MTDRPVRLVLDASAILAYCRGSVAVGEALAELADDSTGAALPVNCLADAYASAVEVDRLVLLAGHEATVLWTDEAGQWQALGELRALTGGVASASAALAAVDEDCWVLTADPGLYEHVGAGDLAIPIEG